METRSRLHFIISPIIVPVISLKVVTLVTQHTHSCSPAVKRCQSNQVCSSGMQHPRCGTGSADTRLSGCHMMRDPAYRCCCCTDMADTAPPSHQGFHSNPVSTHHSVPLQKTGEIGITNRDPSSGVAQGDISTSCSCTRICFSSIDSVLGSFSGFNPHCASHGA